MCRSNPFEPSLSKTKSASAYSPASNSIKIFTIIIAYTYIQVFFPLTDYFKQIFTPNCVRLDHPKRAGDFSEKGGQFGTK
jgi:hypothetical protein